MGASAVSEPAWRSPAGRVRIGVSTCLLGERVRYDGGHKRDRFLVEVLAPFVEWLPVCPELELGLGMPRPPIRLERTGEELRLVEAGSGREHGAAMRRLARRRCAELARLDLSGYVLKHASPSCGPQRVKVWSGSGPPARSGTGLFAAELLRRMPDLPVEDEARLQDRSLRENFLERVFAYQRLRGLFGARWSQDKLVAFHSAHELQLRAHSPQDYRALGRLVAEARLPRAELRERYQTGFMAALRHPATRRRNTNVLQRMQRSLGRSLDAGSRRELGERIESYRLGQIPLLVPITLLRQHIRRLGVESLAGQLYLEPHPAERVLRDHS